MSFGGRSLIASQAICTKIALLQFDVSLVDHLVRFVFRGDLAGFLSVMQCMMLLLFSFLLGNLSF